MQPPVNIPPYRYVETQSELRRYLDEIESATWIAYDTEFISEGRYQAELCLVQVATKFGFALLDPLGIAEMKPFWERLCRSDTTSIAHSCRSELEFCYRALGRFPSRVFDVQLAAGFVGFDYPLNYKSLTAETIGVSIAKNETRTDWSLRPLSKEQLDYALHDVTDLKQIADFLTLELEKAGRVGWFLEETRAFLATLEESFGQENWQKTVGSKKLSRDELAIVRAVWRWRRRKALDHNRPPQRFLRDDLIVELAKRKTADPTRVATLRGVGGSPDSAVVRELSAVVANALALPEAEKPRSTSSVSYPQYSLASQTLGLLLNQYATRRGVSPKLASTTSDVRETIAAREGKLPKGTKPRLASGWRRELFGDFLDDCLAGRYAFGFSNDLENAPLKLLEVGSRSAKN